MGRSIFQQMTCSMALTAFFAISSLHALGVSDQQQKKNIKDATHAIAKLRRETGLKKREARKMATFIETKLPSRIPTQGYYFSRKKTRLPRTIQVDPETGMIFIHLKKHNCKVLGHGARKLATRSIRYSHKRPEVVAHCETKYKIDNEIKAIRALQGRPGIFQVHAILENSKSNSTYYSLMSKLYGGGDLKTFLEKNKKKVTFRQKLRFMLDILKGIESMHKTKYAHRDLGLRNYFVDCGKKCNVKKAKVYVADLGRAAKNGETMERGAQGGYSILAPEGLAYDKLTGDDYIYTDIYALGCIFYRIMHNKKSSWNDVNMLRDQTIPVEARQQRHREQLTTYIKQRKEEIKLLFTKGKEAPKMQQFEQLILKMIDPVRENRPTATELRQALQAIIAG